MLGLPWWLGCKESARSAGDLGWIPGLGRSPGEGNGNPLWYPCRENSLGQRSLTGCSPWGHNYSDTAETKHSPHHAYKKLELKLNFKVIVRYVE